MKDKFRENFWIALPAAVATLILILILSFQTEIQGRVLQPYHLTQVIPYVLVLIGGIVGINVFVVLLTGIVSGAFIMLIGGHTTPVEILKNMGSGVSGMFETCMVAILVAAMCALIREYGGFDALLGWIHKIFRGKKGGQLGMGLLVGTMDIATANNTVAIVMANPIAKEMAEEYGITPRKTASILDTFSCVFQGVIPYGAQMLVAISAVNELGGEISAFQIMPKLFYPMLLLFSSLITIMRRQLKQVEQFKKLEAKKIPTDLDYEKVGSLRIEARQKLEAYRPISIGQASRISGVSPADSFAMSSRVIPPTRLTVPVKYLSMTSAEIPMASKIWEP